MYIFLNATQVSLGEYDGQKLENVKKESLNITHLKDQGQLTLEIFNLQD